MKNDLLMHEVRHILEPTHYRVYWEIMQYDGLILRT